MRNSGLAATGSQVPKENGNGLNRKSLLEALESSGVRLTAQRRALVEELQNAEGHLDASGLLERARRRNASVDRATVYRTLDLLKKRGLVDELDLMHLHGEKHYYEARTGRDHIHLACLSCGRIEEVTSPLYDELKKQIRAVSGFAIEVVRLEVGGRCRVCARKGNLKTAKGKQ
jgi:Fur family ferric uptake transcriptional regulator